MKKALNILTLSVGLFIGAPGLNAQKIIPYKLPDTGQNKSFTETKGEDAEITINQMSFKDNGDGTVTDLNTGLVWQEQDGGETTYENAKTYCDNLVLGGASDWRLPTALELFGINYFNNVNPAINTNYFTKTAAEYWWTSETQIGDASKVWAVNAGGGVGSHPKSETVSAGGTKKFHVRAVRNPYSSKDLSVRFIDKNDGAIKDALTGLVWQKSPATQAATWEQALALASNANTAGKTDWRLPNIKELQSLCDVKLTKPCIDSKFFQNLKIGNYWSSTTMENSTAIAWDMNTEVGIVSYNDKTKSEYVILVRGGKDDDYLNFNENLIPAGKFSMGDHLGFVDPKHPSDELPLHDVKIDSLYISRCEITNRQFISFLNDYLATGLIQVKNNIVYKNQDTGVFCYTNGFAPYYSIGYDGSSFVIKDFRSEHPVVGVMWQACASFCNWLSIKNGLQECFDLKTYKCDFTKNGYRLPTEAEWEYSGRAGKTNPYFNYVWGDDQDITKANWPDSKDPYEGTGEAAYPFTTPVGFYDGTMKLKGDYNWLGAQTSYQTGDGRNAYGLCDMAGNVWEFVNDWYGQNYYQTCLDGKIEDNPKGPDTGFLMPDGKTYRGMRGGNWYNGYNITGGSVNDGHSRVSNRNPTYYRGPQDPNHPWYHIGFRPARKYTKSINAVEFEDNTTGLDLMLNQNYPNPFESFTELSFNTPTPGFVSLKVLNVLGEEITTLLSEYKPAGAYKVRFEVNENLKTELNSGLIFFKLTLNEKSIVNKAIFIK